jgi:hypothetical protein
MSDYTPKMKDIDQLKRVVASVRRLREFFAPEYVHRFLAKNHDCDKHGFGFNLDARFRETSDHKVSFDSWHGWFGNSGCSSWVCANLDSEVFWRCFDRYLNDHVYTIMLGVADLMEAEAQKNIEMLRAEKDRLNELIAALEGEKA